MYFSFFFRNEDNCEEGLANSNHCSTLPSSKSFPSLLPTLPNLTPTIDLQFSNLPSSAATASNPSSEGSPYEFTRVESAYREFRKKSQQHNETYCNSIIQQASPSCLMSRSCSSGFPTPNCSSAANPLSNPTHAKCRQHSRNLSAGNVPFQNSIPIFSDINTAWNTSVPSWNSGSFRGYSPIWTLQCENGFVYAGTGTGSLEVWDIFSTLLKVNFICCEYIL